MRVYISGPVTGMPDKNRAAFKAAEAYLEAWGHEPVNPVADENDAVTRAWEDYLREDLQLLLTCGGIHMLSGWIDSPGAVLENHVATKLRMEMVW